jgi:hypothetical protein
MNLRSIISALQRFVASLSRSGTHRKAVLTAVFVFDEVAGGSVAR